jgi:hypothetical protein
MILWLAYRERLPIDRACAPLLNHMRQFMQQQFLSLPGKWLVLPGSEYHIPTNGISQRIYSFRRPTGQFIHVHPHPAEILAETGFHKAPRALVERLAGRIKHALDCCWRRH